jgi:antitoxin ChpS
MEQLTVRKLGNSIGFTLPAGLARKLRLQVGQSLDARTEEGALILTLPVKPSYALADLVAQCDLSAEQPTDMAEWEQAPPVGRESW